MSDREELLRELGRRDEEILRLRDLLLAKDVELGEAVGRQRELEDITRGLLTIAAQVQARVPILMRLARAVVRHGRRTLRRLRARRGRV
ncbi:MAG TPA: hypothetical protein VD761_10050, partial [Solirubrobacterales bacterium]|nr:hypothetical protein [Solirubrobacterales bacterium]